MKKAIAAVALLSAMLGAATPALLVPHPTVLAPSVSAVDAITIPRMLSCQGKLLNGSGNPVRDSTYSVLFSMYSVPNGGSSFWAETQTVATRTGLFAVLLGSVTPIVVLPEAGMLYLGMAVGADPEMTPRMQIASAAYAYLARKADTANYALSGAGGSGDDAWVRGTPDSVLYTVNRLGIARGGSGNVLLGSSRFSHNNLGVACTTGTAGQNYVYCTVSGGGVNKAGGQYATVSGGWHNRATNGYAMAAGGQDNTADGDHSAVLGGWSNHAVGGLSFIGGGEFDSASSDLSAVAGGSYNSASGDNSFVGGGNYNAARRMWAFVGGGQLNTASGTATTVGGGENDSATYAEATVGGGKNNVAAGEDATVGGGWGNVASAASATIAGGEFNVASETRTAVAGGFENAALGPSSFVGGGDADTARGSLSFVGGGMGNVASGETSAVGGGVGNTASGGLATVAGGQLNVAFGSGATVGGGVRNLAGADGATIGGGVDNYVWGNNATISGGFRNGAATDCAVAGGAYDTSAGLYNFTTGYHSVVPFSYSNSVAFNGMASTANSQLRCGALSKTGGSFTIDDPIDPQNKILNHYFVESPDMSNLYSGSVVLDANGRAEVRLPDYFDALNRNPRVQLTGVGSSDVYVAEDFSGNRIVIGGKPGTKVYWQVTGDRKDQSAEVIRAMMPVEQPKTGALAGRMLDDDFLVGCMAQLERMGLVGKFHFRTADARQRHEDMLRLLRKAELHKNK